MNNKVADQPAHPRRLISAFVIHIFESIISRHAISKTSIFKLISEAEETWFGSHFFGKPEDRFFRVQGKFMTLCLEVK